MSGKKIKLPRFFGVWLVLATVVILWVFDRPVLLTYIHLGTLGGHGDWWHARFVFWNVVIALLLGFLVIQGIYRMLSGSSDQQAPDVLDDARGRALRYELGPARQTLGQDRPVTGAAPSTPGSESFAAVRSGGADAWSLELIQALDWKSFGDLCVKYYEAKGYHSEQIRTRPDGGMDFVLNRKGATGGAAFAVVHCRSWGWKWISVELLQELRAAQQASGAPLGVLITSTYFSEEAMAFAKGKNIELIAGDKLVELLSALLEPGRSRLLNEIAAGDYATPTCPRCDVKMKKLEGDPQSSQDAATEWRCPNYPRCSETFRSAISSQ